jgi:hypothetical protein
MDVRTLLRQIMLIAAIMSALVIAEIIVESTTTEAPAASVMPVAASSGASMNEAIAVTK